VVLLVLAWLWWWDRKAQPWRKAFVRLGSSVGFRAGAHAAAFAHGVFVEVLKLLVENRLPLDQAAKLAAEAAGDAEMSASAGQFAAAIRRGEAGLAADLPGLPPLLSWLIAGDSETTPCCRPCDMRR